MEDPPKELQTSSFQKFNNNSWLKSILIFAYYSFKDPVFQSAVLPYFLNFPNKEQYRFILLTFEHDKFPITPIEKEQITRNLAANNIEWVQSKWHSGGLKLVKKIYDLVTGVFKTIRLVKKYRVNCVYSEGFPGAVIAHYVAGFTGKPHVVHTFEPHTDYMIESGVWKETSWEAILLRKFETRVAKKAAVLMTATQGMIDEWQKKTGAQFYRVPSCVDIKHFQFNRDDRDTVRKKYNIRENEVVIIYLGKFGGMYVEQELFDFFTEINFWKQNTSYVFRFMILSPDKKQKIEDFIKQSGMDIEQFIIESLTRVQVPSYLSAADIAFSGVRQNPSKRFCSPIKHGEYWACGLPVIVPDGISDDYLLVEKYDIGWRMPVLSKPGYKETIKKVFGDWCWEKQTGYRQRAREFVIRDRNVEEYRSLYARIFSEI
jgi:glycosyltransferase involved in cell wall biosynthesis